MPTKKREITIRFVTAARGAKISAIIDALSDQSDDISITCKTLDRSAGRPASKNGSAAITKSKGRDHPEPDEEEAEPHRPQLVYKGDGSSDHKRYIDVEASLAKLGLTRDELLSRRWSRGSPQ